ncbi:Crp/Fnr family transcriptional regulator [Salinimicrobium soli]|uniref:Crp/Fnr family transcriptional regulator n=1 Tax=Salinimicrobium soli TaxID=1254399 RepID=UPI003AAFBF84
MRKNNKWDIYKRAIKNNKLLKDLSPEKLDDFLDEVEEEIWPPDTCSINKPATVNYFHFIVSGRLKVYKVDPATGREFTLFLLKEDDVFDVLCLLDGHRHDVFYETLDRVVMLAIPMDRMRQYIQQNPLINENLLPYLSEQMRILEEYASNITLIDISTRLAKLILNNINAESHQLELINDLSNEELANLIGSTRAVVNRHLQDFKTEGILNLGREKVEIRNLELLLNKAKHRT